MEIEEYDYGRIVIDGRERTNDLIVVPDGLHTDWWRERGHSLSWDDLGPVLEAEPDLLIVGTGTRGNMRPEPELEGRLEERAIDVEVMDSYEAVRRWNAIAGSDEPRAALAIHLTC